DSIAVFCIRYGSLFCLAEQNVETAFYGTRTKDFHTFYLWVCGHCAHPYLYFAVLLFFETYLFTQSRSPMVSRKYIPLCYPAISDFQLPEEKCRREDCPNHKKNLEQPPRSISCNRDIYD